MRALICHSPGPSPELIVQEVPDPQPGAGEVLVRIHAASVNFADLLMISGRYYVQPDPPFICGSEFAGSIEVVGAGVTGWQPGDRVLGSPPGAGCFAEYVAVPADHLLPVPDGMSWPEAASFIITYGTAWYGLRERGRLQAGETLLVTGAGGGVGIAAVDIGSRRGARVIGAAGSADKLALARAHGADGTINYRDADLRARIAALTDGRGYDVLLDNVGGEVFSAALKGSAQQARLLLVGFASGAIPELSAGYILVKNLTVMGIGFGGIYAGSPEMRQSAHRGLLEIHAADPLHPEIGAEYPLAEASNAIALLGERKAAGKVVLLP